MRRKAKQTSSGSSLDLHGFSRDAAVAALEQHLSDCVMQGKDSTDIIHGLGSGAVKKAVHDCLARLKIVRSFQILPTNPGCTRVYL